MTADQALKEIVAACKTSGATYRDLVTKVLAIAQQVHAESGGREPVVQLRKESKPVASSRGSDSGVTDAAEGASKPPGRWS